MSEILKCEANSFKKQSFQKIIFPLKQLEMKVEGTEELLIRVLSKLDQLDGINLNNNNENSDIDKEAREYITGFKVAVKECKE